MAREFNKGSPFLVYRGGARASNPKVGGFARLEGGTLVVDSSEKEIPTILRSIFVSPRCISRLKSNLGMPGGTRFCLKGAEKGT